MNAKQKHQEFMKLSEDEKMIKYLSLKEQKDDSVVYAWRAWDEEKAALVTRELVTEFDVWKEKVAAELNIKCFVEEVAEQKESQVTPMAKLNPEEYSWFFRIHEYMTRHGISHLQYMGLNIEMQTDISCNMIIKEMK